MVWGRELYFDATRVRAAADTDSLVPRFYFEATAHLADVFAADPAQSEESKSVAGDPPIPEGGLPFPMNARASPETEREEHPPRWNLLEERPLDPTRPSHRGYRRTSDSWVSTTDPGATPMWTAGKARLGCHDHYVVDGGKRRTILAALVTPADVMENQPMLDLLWRVRFRGKPTEGVIVYRADAARCNACPLRVECTESNRGRILHRSLYAEYLDNVRGDHATEACQKAMRKRQVWVEPLFAEAKVWHGLRRFRLRGLDNVNIEGLLVAAGQNLKRWLVATGWGRRHAPCGSLVSLQWASQS